MEVKQTGHCLLIIPSDYKSFQEKGGKKTRQREFFSNLHVVFQLQNDFCSPPSPPTHPNFFFFFK